MELLRDKLETIAVKHLGRSSLHGLNQETIQAKKLRNVKVIHDMGGEEILFLYDVTLFGSAKDGMVFTDKAIYWREVLGDAQRIDYREIVESTAHKELVGNNIRILGKDHVLQAKSDYYNLIWELKSELINVISLYESYYKNALASVEKSLVAFAENEEYKEVIGFLNSYQGLFLNEKDKSGKIREISFEAYLIESDFPKAQEELKYIKDENLVFYEKAALLLEQAIKEAEYAELEESRLYAVEREDFKEAYSLFEKQKALNIRQDDHLEQIELEIKEAHYKNLDQDRKAALTHREYERAYATLEEQNRIGIRTPAEIEDISESMKVHEFETVGEDRLKAVENEEYDIAFLLLEKQIGLNLKAESDMEAIRESIEKAKKETLVKYHEKLKLLVDSEDFLESEQVIKDIYKLEPSYSLEKEEILILIYQYKLQEAEKAISDLPDSALKVELEEILDITAKTLYEEVRNAARNKEYDYFEFFPDVWKYIDGYGMSAHHYFALEADVEGLLKALKGMSGDLNTPNIFGHNFVDLLGFACDSSLGSKKENLLEILGEIKYSVELKEIDHRINFLETGLEGQFTSYQLSKEIFEGMDEKDQLKIQEHRLAQLNQNLISISHFAQIIDEMDSEDAYNIDYVSQQILVSRSKDEDDYPIKGEFETLEAYKHRCNLFSQEYVERSSSSEEFRSEVEKLMNLFKAKKARYIPSLSTWIRVEEKQLNILEALETIEGRLGLYNLYFPIKMPAVEIGTYNTGKEAFLMIVDGVIKEMKVPISVAEDFKMNFEELEFNCHRVFEDGLIVDRCIYEFKGEKMVLPFLERRDFSHNL